MIEQAVAALQSGNLSLAERLCRSILSKNREQFGPYLLLGVIHAQRGELTDAVTALRRAIKLNPRSADAYINLGRVQFDLGEQQRASESYTKALSLDPRSILALSNYSIIHRSAGRLEEALALCDRAIAIDPGYGPAHNNRANILFDLKRFDEACGAYQAALKADPASPYTRGDMLFAIAHVCRWQDFDAEWSRVISDLKAGRGSQPFALLSTPAGPGDQLLCANIYVKDKFPQTNHLPPLGKRPSHDRIRIAYVSADFHDHATACLIAGLFEAHDKSRFEMNAVSFGPAPPGEMRERLKASFDRFFDVQNQSDLNVARLLRTHEIDIAVDLKGFTQNSRPGIFAHRAAPVQVNYLGYPGTMGAGYIDYLVADGTIIPQEDEKFYSEKIIRLPHSYQPNDRTRAIAGHTPSRTEMNLPEDGFVFCSFNNNYKITPAVFDVWMRLLRQVDGSVLWLLAGNGTAKDNLRREAAIRGIDTQRIVFAPRTEVADHLARHRAADLFLDTLPCNAHTTASDALWAGLPLVTCIGSTFAGRVAASVLNAAGLPELVTTSLEDYEALALKLARDPALLGSIKAKLAAGRLTSPLFDTARYARHIEAAYTTMWQRAQNGEAPSSFTVEPLP
ncbi:MAG: tetratricopeptide repeat protein [Xanthobacteraceae bacterium]|nr:tetratricopeptide repeat protein [Xanthobacteraceae bacterium]